MNSMKYSRIETFKAMSLEDKLFTVLLVLVGIALFAYGLYLVGYNGLYLLGGAIVLIFVMEFYRSAEIKLFGEAPKKKKPSISSQFETAGPPTNNNDGLIQNIIDRRKQHPQQGLLDSVMHNSATTEWDEEQARADHEYLVELARKKQEAMRTAVTGPPADPNITKKIQEKQQAYVKGLMEPTIVPQKELAEKSENNDD